MGRPDVTKGVDHPDFQRFVDADGRKRHDLDQGHLPRAADVAGPPYDDVVPFGRKLVETFPDRVIWGTDWPHPNMKSHMPDDGKLVDFIPRIAERRRAQKKLLVDNPMRLYWS
jgi:2-pyrone-4,6-dicarboxylate lactonase